MPFFNCDKNIKPGAIIVAELWAVISNAAVLVCAEVFWQTEAQWESQMNVNFWGAVHLSNQFRNLMFSSQCKSIILYNDINDFLNAFLHEGGHF